MVYDSLQLVNKDTSHLVGTESIGAGLEQLEGLEFLPVLETGTRRLLGTMQSVREREMRRFISRGLRIQGFIGRGEIQRALRRAEKSGGDWFFRIRSETIELIDCATLRKGTTHNGRINTNSMATFTSEERDQIEDLETYDPFLERTTKFATVCPNGEDPERPIKRCCVYTSRSALKQRNDAC